jgi:trans-aconitate methyltransferase
MTGGFHELAERVAETLDIGPGTRVFEVDCGDGEFLYPFHQNGYIVGGTDGDAAMIEQAIAAMPDGLFTVAAGAALDPGVPWDVVVCRSLSGTPDVGYMRGLVARMFAKATHAIALLDVPENAHRALMRALAEVGAKAVQIEGPHLFARV